VNCFNPRTPAGCDMVSSVHSSVYFGFNPRTPAGCDDHCFRHRRLFGCFNPRTPAGCDLTYSSSSPRPHVSIHAPLRGATNVFVNVVIIFVFQSTHPCGVRLLSNVKFRFYLIVSIHAPLRGATRRTGISPGNLGVSIHAPLRGATPPETRWYRR